MLSLDWAPVTMCVCARMSVQVCISNVGQSEMHFPLARSFITKFYTFMCLCVCVRAD